MVISSIISIFALKRRLVMVLMKVLKRFMRVGNFLITPITPNSALFLNVLVLLIFPTLLNAFFINRDEYISFSSAYPFGILIKYGASFPYILFIPFVVSYVLSLIACLCKKRKVCIAWKAVVYVSAFSLCAINIFLLFNFKTMLSPSIVLLLYETDTTESLDFIQSYFGDIHSVYAYIVIILIAALLMAMERFCRRMKFIVDCVYIKFFLLIVLFYMFWRFVPPCMQFVNLFKCNDLDSVEFWYLDYRPDCNTLTNVIYSFYTFEVSQNELLQSKSQTLKMQKGATSLSESIVIFVIGESFNKHHSYLYGYVRPTNPHMVQEYNNGNLYVFSDVVTPYNMTSHVMKNLFSVNSIMDRENWAQYPIFPAVFRDAGFNVYFWDNQKTLGKADVSDYSIFSYLYDPDVVKISYTECNSTPYEFDMDLLKDFFYKKARMKKKTFAIFHLRGQHDMAENRYPHTDAYVYFTSDSIIGDFSKKQKSQIAFYDNATRYNDDVIYYIINKIRDQECVMVYLSDHGEEVHDYRNHYGRTQENVKTKGILKYQYEIPFMIWCSDKYIERFPEKVNAIQTALDKPFMIDNTCQILFDLAEIRSTYYHKERDLISPNYQPYTYRRVQDNVIYEEIMKK